MDIRKWLDDTILPDQPPSPLHHQRLVPLPRPERREHISRRRRHQPKPGSSDSSILPVRPARKRPPSIEHESDIEPGNSDSICSSASHPAYASSQSCSSGQPYTRKPRRKTRPERYEPVAKDVNERGLHVRRRKEGESKKSKRTSGRNKANKSGSGIVGSFHARNVPADRLTLKPRETLGIFNKGRASSPVRGRGLPDLVFSEMKFLQKHRDQPDAVPRSGMPKKKRKKDHAHVREEEISAYFTTVRPPLVERDVNIQAKEGSSKTKPPHLAQGRRKRSTLTDNAVPTVELPDKESYLGFGSKRPRHESGSYFSWSESVRAPSVSPVRARAGPTIEAGQLDPLYGKKGTDGGDVLHSQPAPPPKPRHMTDSSGGRFEVSSLVPAHHRLSRSHSLPHCTSPPRPTDLVDRAAKSRTAETAASPSSIPPVATAQRKHMQQRCHPPVEEGGEPKDVHSPGRASVHAYTEDDAEHTRNVSGAMKDTERYTLAELGMLLQECGSAVGLGQQMAVSQEDDTPADYTELPSNGISRSYHQPYSPVHRLPSVRFAEPSSTYRPRVPYWSGPSIYLRQEQRHRAGQQPRLDDVADLEDDYSATGGRHEGGVTAGYEDGHWGGQAEGEACGRQKGLAETGRAVRHRADGGEGNVVQANGVMAGGFWRPHRLY